MNTPGIAAILVRSWSALSSLLRVVGGGASASSASSVPSRRPVPFLRDRRIGSGAAKIAIGDSQAHVVALLGRPTQITDCSTGYGGYKRGQLGASEIAPGCVEEYWYYSFYFPASSTYSFDSEKKVIRKYALNSP